MTFTSNIYASISICLHCYIVLALTNIHRLCPFPIDGIFLILFLLIAKTNQSTSQQNKSNNQTTEEMVIA
jgi:hypothetical protein